MKILKIITIELLILTITIASFIGIYKKDEYRVINLIPNYKLGMDFGEKRVLNFKVDDSVKETLIYDKDGNLVKEKEEGIEYTEENGYKTEEVKTNAPELLTGENYEKTKNILLKRLSMLEAGEYNVELNKETGELKITIPENNNSDLIEYYLQQSGTFTLTDADTNEVLLDETHLKDAGLLYGSNLNDEGKSESHVYLQLKFDKEGIKKLDELSKIYIAKTVEKENEDGEKEQTTEEKKISINLNGMSLGSTVITNILYNNTITLTLGASTDQEEFSKQSENATNIAKILNSGTLPLTYNVESNEEKTNSENEHYFENYELAFMILAIVLCAILIIKYKTRGMILSLLQIGLLATLLIVLRYTNVIITKTGIFGILIAEILNCMFLIRLMKSECNFNSTLVKHFLLLIPVYMISIMFAFANSNHLGSLGMTLTWGAMLIYLYNLIFTKPLTEILKEDKNEKV